jgi:hypothetical protein
MSRANSDRRRALMSWPGGGRRADLPDIGSHRAYGAATRCDCKRVSARVLWCSVRPQALVPHEPDGSRGTALFQNERPLALQRKGRPVSLNCNREEKE